MLIKGYDDGPLGAGEPMLARPGPTSPKRWETGALMWCRTAILDNCSDRER